MDIEPFFKPKFFLQILHPWAFISEGNVKPKFEPIFSSQKKLLLNWVPVVGVDAAGAEVEVAGEADVALLGTAVGPNGRHSEGQPADRVGAGEPEPDGCREAFQFLIFACSTWKLQKKVEIKLNLT